MAGARSLLLAIAAATAFSASAQAPESRPSVIYDLPKMEFVPLRSEYKPLQASPPTETPALAVTPRLRFPARERPSMVPGSGLLLGPRRSPFTNMRPADPAGVQPPSSDNWTPSEERRWGRWK